MTSLDQWAGTVVGTTGQRLGEVVAPVRQVDDVIWMVTVVVIW